MTLPTAPRTDPALALLRAGIPLSLLLDLAQADPHSEEIYEQERRQALTPAPRPPS